MNNKIKFLRKTLQLTQSEFANRIGVTKSAISNIETGRYNISKSILLLICREYHVRYEWLITGSGDMFENPRTDFKTKVLETLSNLSDEDWDYLEQLCEKFTHSP